MIHSQMPAEVYHASPAVSSTPLVAMAKTPKHFLHAWKGPKKVETAAQKRGTFFHDLLLEQNIANYVARPLKEDGELVRSNSKEYLAFLEANPGKKPIHPDDFNEMYSALTAFAENKKAMALMGNAKIEHSIFATDPETGIEIKARPDIWANGILADLKSTKNIPFFDKTLFRSLYDVRLIHYAKCIEFATGEKITNFYFIPFEQNEPFQSQIVQLTDEQVYEAEKQWRNYMNVLSVCLKTGMWPGYTEDIRYAVKPMYLSPEEISFDEEEIA